MPAPEIIPAKEAGLLAAQIGRTLELEPEVERLDPLAQLRSLSRRLRELDDPAANRYKRNFHAFLTECVWTKDEAASRVARIPDWPLFHDLAHDLITERKLFIQKSRRVLASWVVCAFDVWVAAGGVDPRWETLTNGDTHRQVWLAARQFEQANWFLFERIKFLIDQSVARGLKEKWPDFPDWRWKEGHGIAANGSRISAVPQGADVFHGPAATLLHLEEVSRMEQAKQTIEGAIPTLRGGGHLVAITTPLVNSYASLIVSGDIGGKRW